MGDHLWTTRSSISTPGMFKHFIGGLVLTVIARSVSLLLYPGNEFSLSAQSCSRVLLPGLEAACRSRLTHFPSVPWVQESHCTGARGGERAIVPHSRWGDVLGRGITTGQSYLPAHPRIDLIHSFYFTASSKAAGNSQVFFLSLSWARCSSDSGLPRQGSFLSAGKIDQRLSLHTAVSQTPKGLFIL